MLAPAHAQMTTRMVSEETLTVKTAMVADMYQTTMSRQATLKPPPLQESENMNFNRETQQALQHIKSRPIDFGLVVMVALHFSNTTLTRDTQLFASSDPKDRARAARFLMDKFECREDIADDAVNHASKEMKSARFKSIFVAYYIMAHYLKETHQ